jgi:hypothetical protein
MALVPYGSIAFAITDPDKAGKSRAFAVHYSN